MQLPLDVDEESLIRGGPALDTPLSSLDANGWNPDRVTRPAAFIRLRYIMSVFKEEILEISLGSANAGAEYRLK